MAERAQLDFVGHGANQRIRAERPIPTRRRNARRNIGSHQIRPEVTVGFPPQNSAHHRIGAQIWEHREANIRVRRELARVALHTPRTRAKADHTNNGTTTG